MNNRSWRFAGVVLVFQLGLCATSEAGTVTWSVKNSGGTVVCSGNGNGTANLPAACGADLDFQASGAAARIEAMDTGTNDILQLVNTRIVAKRDLTDYVLTFYHTFIPGPKKTDYYPIYYRTHMYGIISATPGTNKITVTSTVEHPVGTVLLPSDPLTHSPGAMIFNLWDPSSTSTDMDQNRKIIANVKFTLANTKNLNFPAGRFVKVSAQSYPDEKEDSDGPSSAATKSEATDLNTILSEVQRAIEHGGKVCLGVSLPDSGCSGINFVK